MLPFLLIPVGLALLTGGGIAIALFWDEIRDAFSAWLIKENLQSSRIMKVVLCFDSVRAGICQIGRKLKIIQTNGQKKTKSLEDANIDDLPREIQEKIFATNKKKRAEMDITSQVLTY